MCVCVCLISFQIHFKATNCVSAHSCVCVCVVYNSLYFFNTHAQREKSGFDLQVSLTQKGIVGVITQQTDRVCVYVVYIFALEPPCVCVCLLCTAGSELITALLEILIYPEPHRDTHTHQKACVCDCMCVCIPTLIGAKNRNKQRPENLIEPANSTTTAPVKNQWATSEGSDSGQSPPANESIKNCPETAE